MTVKRQEMPSTLVLGRYRIVQHLARGGMGIVYLARTEGAEGFTRPVVVKRIIPHLAEDEATARGFVREARILANLQHPGIVNVIDFDEEDGAYVMVLEYVHGYTLGQWHRYVIDTRKQMPIEHAIYIVTRVLDALHYAHTFVRPDGISMQIVHRDVSPGNILIDTQAHVKLLDFGIARAQHSDAYHTRDGKFKGKLTYAAPEVYEGSASGPVSDVYSTGVVLYELLAGQNPFRAKDMAEIVRRVLTEKVAPMSVKREDVSPELDAVIERAIAKDPADRYPTAAAFAEALRAARPQREEDFSAELVELIGSDFNGDMPVKLGLEPLQDRDAAWREAQKDSERGTRLGSTSPAIEEGEATVTVLEDGTLWKKGGSDRVTRSGPAIAPRRTRVAVIAAGLAVAAIGVASTVWMMSRKPAPVPSRFVVVEKQARDDPATHTGSTASIPGAETPSIAEPAASSDLPATRSVKSAISGSARAPEGAALSRAVQRQRPQIESCFQRHVKEIDGRPEVSVQYRVGQSGKVESAHLSPPALNGTSLGQCLIAVAKTTNFGPLSESVSFTIPITARRVK